MRFIRHPKDFYAGLIFIAFGKKREEVFEEAEA